MGIVLYGSGSGSSSSSVPKFLTAGSIVGDTYASLTSSGEGASQWAPTRNVIHFVPILLKAGTLDRLGSMVLQAGGADELLRLGVYNADATTLEPGTLLVDGGATAFITGTGPVTVTVAQAISTAGLYWLAVVRQGSTDTGQLVRGNLSDQRVWLPFLSTQAATPYRTYTHRISTAATFTGALPGTAPAMTKRTPADGDEPILTVRFSA